MSVLDRLGVYLFPWGKERPSVPSIVELTQLAEELGFDSVHLPWHYTLPTTGTFPAFGSRYLLDPLVVLPILVDRTRRIRIGLNSAIAPALHPFAWAQYFASLDVVSGGRVIPGVAVGWWPDDFKVGGVSSKERGARTDEALEAMARLWAGEELSTPGRFWDCTGLRLDPLPVQQPFPIWLGGGVKSARRAAKWATALFPLNPTAAEVRDELRPTMDAAAAAERRHLDLVTMNYAIVSNDAAWIRDEIHPKLVARLNGVSVQRARDEHDNLQLLSPDDRVMYGSAEQCAERGAELFGAGVDYMVIDFQFHGLETATFAREHMQRFVQSVVPLLERAGVGAASTTSRG